MFGDSIKTVQEILQSSAQDMNGVVPFPSNSHVLMFLRREVGDTCHQAWGSSILGQVPTFIIFSWADGSRQMLEALCRLIIIFEVTKTGRLNGVGPRA